MSSSAIVPPTLIPRITGTNGLLPSMPSAKIINILNQPTINGNNDIFTVPEGKRAVFGGQLANQSGGALNATPQLKINGVYVQTALPTAVANNGGISYIPWNTFPVAEAGETLSLNCAGIMQLFGYIVLYDKTDGILSPKLLTLQTGDNILYKCPAGKVAFLTNASNAGNAPLRTFNSSGALRTYKVNLVPSGGSPANTNIIAFAFTTANGAVTNTTLFPAALNPGDYINLNVDAGTATQFAYLVNVMEQFIP